MSEVDVAIAGLGPTGLLLAHLLGKAGHRVVVLEREPRFYGNARAVYTDDECMRLLQAAGVADEVHRDMLLETPVQIVRPDGTVLWRYLPRKRPFGWPVVNFFYQPYLETRFAELLARHPNVEVRRGREVVDFTQDDAGVTVVHQATQLCRFRDEDDGQAAASLGDPDPTPLRARWLIGADGGRSSVRGKLGVEMNGRSFPEPWLVVDLQQKDRSRGLRHLPYFNFVADPELPTVSCVQPDGFHRFEFRLMPGQTKEELERPETVRRLLSRWVDPDLFEVKRRLVYTFKAMVATRWREGRVLLAGDAAHMTPQFMGQGASSGFRDSANLAWKLDLVLRGLASAALLDTYERERSAHAKAMIDVSVLMKDTVSMTHPVGTALRDWAFKVSQRTPGLKTWLAEGGFKPKPAYARGSYFGFPRRRRRGPEGALSPQPDVRGVDGRRVRFDDVTGPGFAVVGLGVDPRATLGPRSLDALARLGARYVALYQYGGRPQGVNGVVRDAPAGLAEVEDITGELVPWFRSGGVRASAVAILRPDKFTYAVVRAEELDAAVERLAGDLGGAR
jgi:3-(3-hydroxy-phenyl)propionate hydroxylase